MNKTSKIWIFLLVLTGILMATGWAKGFFSSFAPNFVYPMENGLRFLVRGAERRISPFFNAQKILARNRDLEDEVARLRLDAVILRSISAENRELRESCNLPERVNARPVRVEPLSYGGSLGWWQTVTINKGEASGIKPGDAVVALDGLYGIVRKVYGKSSLVELITDPNMRISCELELPRDYPSVRGILHGDGWKTEGGFSFLAVSEPLRLDYMKRELGRDFPLPPRTGVVTSGLGEKIPAGIRVGWLVDSFVDSDGLYRRGRVLSAVDFAKPGPLFVLADAGGRL